MIKKSKLVLVLAIMIVTIVCGSTQAHTTSQDKKLAKLVKDANLIVTGKVTDISVYGRPNNKSSEWYIATIEIQEVISCTFSDCDVALAKSTKKLRALITNTSDNEPRLAAGQENIFILVDSRRVLQGIVFTLFSDLQVQPLENLEKIKNLKGLSSHNNSEKKTDQLSQLVHDSDVIVVGIVTGLKPTNPYSMEAEAHHLPAWQTATVEVSQVLKCDRPECKEDLKDSGYKVLVLCSLPDSQGRVFSSDPVLKLGQKGVFILFGGIKRLSDSVFQLYFDIQVQPLNQVSNIQKLVEASS